MTRRAGRSLVGGAVCGGVGLIVACGGGDAAPAVPSRDHAPPVATVMERWISPPDTAWDVDTPALWRDGDRALVLATAKGTHDLKLFDAATGAFRGTLGGPGAGPGRFRRPNAVVVAGDLALVVERDNHRVQVLHMPEGASRGSFGQDELVKPYGIVLGGTLPDLTVWVTDDYEVPGTEGVDLTRRIHRFEVRFAPDGTPSVGGHAAFGDAAGPGALAVVETIGLDEARGRLLVADEAAKAYVVYDTAGRYAGGPPLAEGHIVGDPEGMALVRCRDESGYWIVTDQQPQVSWFRVFRRGDLGYVGSFRGTLTANTDGVSFVDGEVPGFGGPVFLAVQDDQAVSAFAWSEVASALGLAPGCGGVG